MLRLARMLLGSCSGLPATAGWAGRAMADGGAAEAACAAGAAAAAAGSFFASWLAQAAASRAGRTSRILRMVYLIERLISRLGEEKIILLCNTIKSGVRHQLSLFDNWCLTPF